MTDDHVIKLVKKYEDKLYAMIVIAKRGGDPLSHIYWMCGRIEEILNAGDQGVAACTLGFIQGVLYDEEYLTIEDIIEDNKTLDSE